MSLEKDLSQFWHSYLPVIQAVEAMLAQDYRREEVLPLYENVVPGKDWQITLHNQQKWYDGLLISEVRIPCNGASKTLLFRPKYKELPDGKVIWYSEMRQKEANPRSERQGYDLSLLFSPQFRLDWQRVEHHLPDFRRFTSPYGVLDTCLEERDTLFLSPERSLWYRELKEEYDEDLNPKEKPRLKLISVELGYQELEEGMSDEAMGRAMDGMWEGYSYIQSIQFRAEDIGSGEIDRFLRHVGVIIT